MKFSSAMMVAGLAAIAMLATPLASKVIAQDGPPPGPPMFEELNLTESQRTQLEQIHQNTRTQIENLLTEQQRQQVRSAIESGSNPREAMRAANLTTEQRDQVRSIMEAAREQSQSVFTDEQRAQLEQLREEHHGDGPRGGRPHDGGERMHRGDRPAQGTQSN
ncbi:MAG TPA: Spy/CpxP family protein refolding chaperone [Chroococcidiopsis sp.]